MFRLLIFSALIEFCIVLIKFECSKTHIQNNQSFI